MHPLSRRTLLLAGSMAALPLRAAETFVGVSRRDPRYLELTDGSPYIPIGLNLIPPPGRDPEVAMRTYLGWLDKLTANGVLTGKRTTLIWCRDLRSDWRSELERGEAPEPLRGEVLNLSGMRGNLRAFDPWSGQWANLRARKNRTALPEFRRSLVLRAD